MVGPIRFDGPVSGIDYTSIIEKMLEGQRRPQQAFQARIDVATTRKNALLDVNISLLALKGAIDALAKPSFYNTSKVSSSNESVLAASGTSSAGLGSNSFTVRRLAQAHQAISNGFADSGTTAVTAAAGTVSIEIGGGHLDRATPVAFLNGQAGFDRGSIRIVDSAGRVGIVDLSGAVTVKDILDEINSNTSASVRATVAGNRLVLQDLAGGAGNMVVSDFGTDATATSLGIARTSVTVGMDKFVFGTDLNTVGLSTPLALLNEGHGVRRNADGTTDFTITPTSGGAIAVDLQAADVTVGDAINRINNAAIAAGSNLRATLVGNALHLNDTSGGGSVSISSLAADSFAAVDLGLAAITNAGALQSNAAEDTSGTASGALRRLVGSSLVPTLNSAKRSLLNGGTQTQTGADTRGVADGTLTLTDRNGLSVTVNVGPQVFNAKDGGTTAAGATSLTLTAAPAGIGVGGRIRVATSAGVEYRTVTNIAGNVVSFDQALVGSVAGGNGIHGLNDGVEDIVRLVNDRAAAANVKVRLEANGAGNGLRVVDTSGGAGNLIVSGTPGADLGINGSVAASVINGTDLDPQWLDESTLLAALNGGQGVAAGKIHIADAHGKQFDVDLSQAGDTTLARVIQDINGAAGVAASGVVARINDTGDGLLITDTAGGAPTSTLTITELNGGRTARDLNIAGAAPGATPTQINGSFEIKVDIAAGSTLQGVSDAINARGLGVTAAIINDGSGLTPYRLTLTSNRTGAAARFTADSALSALSFSTSIRGQDSVLLSGPGTPGVEPTVISSSTNTVSGILPGVTLTLKGTSAAPVTVTVVRDNQAITDQAQRFVETYNDAIKKIRDYTAFNPDTFATGPLFSDAGILRTRRDLARLAVSPVVGIPTAELNSLAEVGIRVAAEGALSFDSAAFSSKLESSFDQVQNLFILQRKLTVSTPLKDLNSGAGIMDNAGADFKVTARDGVVFNVDLAGAKTVGDLLGRINTAAGNGGRVTASIAADGFSLQLVDSSATSTTPFSVADLAGSDTAAQLKIVKTLALGANTIKGDIIGLKGDPGAAARFSEALDFITADGTGLISSETDALDRTVESLKASIERNEKRVLQVQDNLIRQFTNLEKIIAQSQGTQQRLSQLLAGLTSQGNGSF